MKKLASFIFSLFVVSLFALPSISLAFTGLSASSTGVDMVENNVILSDNNPILIATNLINSVMVFLGILAVVIILMGGFKWMTAMGSEDKIKKAQQLMTAGIIGLVIILAAWGIARFVVTRLASTI